MFPVTVRLRSRPGCFCSSCCQIDDGIRLVGEQSSARVLLPSWLLPGRHGIRGGTSQLGLDLLDRGRATFQILRQLLDDLGLPFSDADWAGQVTQGVLDHELVLATAQEQTDRRLIGRVLQQLIDHGQVEVELTDEGRFARYGLQLDDDEATQLQMIEEQVDLEVLVTDLKRNLPTNEREAGAQLQQEPLDVRDQRVLDVALARGSAVPRKSNRYGSLNTWAARSESGGDGVVLKLFRARPARLWICR